MSLRASAFLGLTIAALATPIAGSASAQDAQPAWQKICGTNPADNVRTCNVTQGLRSDAGQFVAQVQIQETGDQKRFLIAVPEGVILPPGLQLKIDASSTQTIPYRICARGACFADATVDNDFIAALKRGSNLTVTTLNQAGEGVDFPFTLAGFTATYNSEGVDAAQLQAEQQKLRDGLQQRAEEARQRLLQGSAETPAPAAN